MPIGLPSRTREPLAARFTTLTAGTLLWRVERKRPTDSDDVFREDFKEDQRWGGRFDPVPVDPDDAGQRIPYCYAALDDLTAVAELLLRDVPFETPRRYIPIKQVRDRALSVLQVRKDLPLVSLTTLTELSAVEQDPWLIQADPDHYITTQQWSNWLRRATFDTGTGHVPAAGLIWPSKRNPEGRCLILFGDRCGDAVVRSPYGSMRLQRGPGRQWLEDRLSVLMTKLGTPPKETTGEPDHDVAG